MKRVIFLMAMAMILGQPAEAKKKKKKDDKTEKKKPR